MSLKEAYLIELERETENTRKMIGRIEDRHLDFRPHEQSYTMRQLAGHIVELHSWVGNGIRKDELDFHQDYRPFYHATAQELREAFEAHYAQNVAQVNAMSEADWMQTWTMKAGDHIIAKMPKAGAIRYIIFNHLIHHRGQLSVYLRLNNIPVPGMYGPSADER
ncbi:MAG: DinB family protein [Taibaiella sp.]|nr:DinB family protein [Taibaiella sp.]